MQPSMWHDWAMTQATTTSTPRNEAGAVTWTHDRDVLVRSSVLLVNQALAAGRAARPALARYKRTLADQELRLACPLPGDDTRYAGEVEQARDVAAALTERWASLTCHVIDTCPERFDDLDYAVWGADPQPEPAEEH